LSAKGTGQGGRAGDGMMGHRDSGGLTVVAATDGRRARLPTAWCAQRLVVALLVALLDCTAVAGAHQPLPLRVQARSSGHAGSPSVTVAVRSTAHAECRLTVIAGRLSTSFPAMITDDRGRLTVSWQVPAGAPSGRWTFALSCTHGRRAGREIDHAIVLPRGRKSTNLLVADSSSQLVQGDLVGARLRAREDSYASSCSVDACFADDPLWRASGESTWYAVGRRPDLGGIVGVNAGSWLNEARGHLTEGVKPVVGAIAVWLPNTGGASSTGHVAYVAGISDARVLVDDSNWGQPGLRVHSRWVPASSIGGYIYGGPAGSSPGAVANTPSPPAVGPPSNLDPDASPLSFKSIPGGPGLIVPQPPPEESIPTGPGPGVPPESPGGNPPTPPLQATLPPTPTAPIPESLTSILPQARQIMAQSETIWSKAAAVRNLVRATLSDQNDCGVMATAFWSVGSIIGLPLRLLDSSANGQNPFDTHATVEVWLAGLGRWAISDPTFNGYWTASPEGPPVSAEFMQKAMRTGTNSALYWHGAGTPNSILPSQYYVDPTYLYSYIDFLAFVPSLGSTFMVDSEADAFSAPEVLVPTTTTDFESLPPNAQTLVTIDQRTEAASSAGASNITLPPSYAGALVYEGQVTVGSDGRAPLPLTEQALAVVVSVDTNSGGWQIEVGGGIAYKLDAHPQAQVSPMIFFIPPVYLVAGGAVSGPVTVRIWTVKGFPSSREVTSQWDGG
jgi:surface antigen